MDGTRKKMEEIQEKNGMAECTRKIMVEAGQM